MRVSWRSIKKKINNSEVLSPLEFDFTTIINVPTIYNPLGSFLRHQLGTSGITVRMVFLVCLVFMISSYCFILQPEYPAPDVDENGEPLLGSEDITIFKEADGTYSFHVDGTDIYIPISEEEAEFNLEGGAKLVEKER